MKIKVEKKDLIIFIIFCVFFTINYSVTVSKKDFSCRNNASNSSRVIFSFCKRRSADLWRISIFSRMISLALAQHLSMISLTSLSISPLMSSLCDLAWARSRPMNTSSSSSSQQTTPILSDIPKRVTIFLASLVAFLISLDAPVVMSSKISCSAIRPPRDTIISSSSLPFVMNMSSLSGRGMVQPAAPIPVGMMETVYTGPTSGSTWNRIAWPDS